MALLTRLLALTGLTRLPWAASAQDPLAGPPWEFATADGALFKTADGQYVGVTDHG